MSLLSANISILCDLTCQVCDLSEETGSSAQWHCCTRGYFSPSPKSRTISENSKQWGSHTRVGTACCARMAALLVLLQDTDLRPCSFVITGSEGQPCSLPWWVPDLPTVTAPAPAWSPRGAVQNITHHGRLAGGCVGPCMWWGTAMWDLFPALPMKTSRFHFWSKPSKCLSSVLPLCRMGLSVLSSWERSLNKSWLRECVAGWMQDSIKEWLEMVIMWEVY